MNFRAAKLRGKLPLSRRKTKRNFPCRFWNLFWRDVSRTAAGLGWETEKDLQIAENCLALCDLKNYENRLMNQLSGGERQRVILARALATEAKILLLDEPTTNLDLAHQAMMFRLVRERCETCESSAILITHDLNLASEFADEIILVKERKNSGKRRTGKSFDRRKSARNFRRKSFTGRKSGERKCESYDNLLKVSSFRFYGFSQRPKSQKLENSI